VIGETNQNDVRLINSPERGGYGLDGVWSDDFHHSVHALLTGERDGYYQDFGSLRHVARAYESPFVYDGCYSHCRRRRHGSRVADQDRSQFVVCVQNHDQVGNRAHGERLGALVPPAVSRLACGLLLLSPCTPLLFMGEEYGESRPFPFFCSFGDPHLAAAVRRGRRKEFAELAFRWGTGIPDPQAIETFDAARLSWQWPAGSPQAGLRALYRDLLAARRTWPPLADRVSTTARLVPTRDAQDVARDLLVVERGRGALLACANVTALELPLAVEVGERALVLSTEDQVYGGQRTPDAPPALLAPYELAIFGSPQWRGYPGANGDGAGMATGMNSED
jgi:maltooligosyltrehalose trehalohydrolase